MKMQTYLDNSATTRISDGALACYTEVSREHFGNPSSLHSLGLDAEKILAGARADILRTLGARGGHLVFTASGSEANNLAIGGRAHAKARFRGGKILTTAGEHASVSSPLSRLRDEGFRTVEIPTPGGILDMDALAREMTPDVILVTMMLVNNETGAQYDLPAVAALMKRNSPEAVLHADATQAFMKVPFTPQTLGADLITLSSHKIHGPKGVGALYVSDAVVKNHGLAAQILGGGQEEGFRSGTENVPGAAAFAFACREEAAAFAERTAHMEELRARLLTGLANDPALAGVSQTLPPVHAPHILNLTLPGIKSETMLHYLSAEGIYVSSGSACSSHGGHSSPALMAFGRSAAEADSSIRVSFSYENTPEDTDRLLTALAAGVGRLAGRRR